MYFEQVKTPGLGCFSYIIGCPRVKKMIVVDPKRDIEIYKEISKNHGMQITHIFDTHVHADHVSGACALANDTGAEIYLHESAPAEFKHKKIKHNDMFELGSFTLRVLHTPGHTPNSISLLVTDLGRSSAPAMLLSGDLLFVGDTGRPDLPGEEILDEQIENLFTSLHSTLKDLPDGLEVYPAHGQGSLCGQGMSAKPHTTLGYERVANPMLQLDKLEDFKKRILSNLPMRPQSFSHIIATNLKGAPLLSLCDIKDYALSPTLVLKLRDEGAVVLDVRDSLSFASAHIPGSINVSAKEASAINWIGTVVKPHASIILVVENDAEFLRMNTELRRIGYDDVKGYLRGGMHAWIGEGYDIANLAQISHNQLKKSLNSSNPPLIVDVRSEAEYKEKHLPNSIHLPFDQIVKGEQCPSSDTDKVVVCQSGYRAAIAASLLQTQGCDNIGVFVGGLGNFSK